MFPNESRLNSSETVQIEEALSEAWSGAGSGLNLTVRLHRSEEIEIETIREWC